MCVCVALDTEVPEGARGMRNSALPRVVWMFARTWLDPPPLQAMSLRSFMANKQWSVRALDPALARRTLPPSQNQCPTCTCTCTCLSLCPCQVTTSARVPRSRLTVRAGALFHTLRTHPRLQHRLL